MEFNPNQMREDALIKDGRYKFKVINAREKRSTNGNDMINLKLSLDINGRKVTYFDSLILMPSMFWKVEHFCQASGMPEKIDQGRLMAQDCDNREGYIDIIQKINKETGEMGNQTKDYVKPENLGEKEQESLNEFNDDIPNFA